MKIDFHTHGKLAKKLPFSKEYTDWLFGEAKISGLDALCLTEHFNTLGFHDVYEYIASNYERDGDTFLANGVRIFPGMEVDIKERGHILVLGKMEDILELNTALEPYKEKESFLEFKELIPLLKTKEVIIGAAHPFRDGSNIPNLPMEQLIEFDFIDCNGKDMAVAGEENLYKINAFSQQLGKPYVAGSDTHQSFQYGCICNEFYNSVNTIEKLKEEIALGNYEMKVSDYIDFQVKTASVLKKALKSIHQNGGDYVSVLIGEEGLNQEE